jgi:hypothetical protein
VRDREKSSLDMPTDHAAGSGYWRDLAQQMRSLAERMNDQISKEMMLMVAQEYERLAREIEKRAKG